ncbi:hypothetical protein BOTCAL_0404g00140 [Botryotinia calthae]|uniref:Uncharacterized protein n=1 Tax=Botryotinia calthae TaxID=38488 RepID=A0A4Y8CQ73_9HELO|nr:hypothetical protein BOTCAL_0404g00140 [Botryotinia calthae]
MNDNEDRRGPGGMKLLIKATRNAAKSSNLDHQLSVLKRRNKRDPITRKHAELRTRLESKRARPYDGYLPTGWGFYVRNVKLYSRNLSLPQSD